ICTEAALTETDVVVDAAGPETLSFGELVALIRRTTGARALVVNAPAWIMRLGARALHPLVRDVVLTPEEIDGLMAGLPVSHTPALGQIDLTRWLEDAGASIGNSYANELQRHFA